VPNEEGDGLDTDQRIRHSATRIFLNGFAILVALGIIGAWASTGIYYTEPGEAAVVLVLGRYHDTVNREGMHWALPAPLGFVETVNVTQVRRLEFGKADRDRAITSGDEVQIHKDEVQTADSNIVLPVYVIQYQINDPFTYLYRLQNPTKTLRDATQAAMREVVGQHDIDEVLASNRQGIEDAARAVLEDTMAAYVDGDRTRSPFKIRAIQLQSVQPPPEVQQAFDDVVAARQDKDRAVSVAEGDSLEIREQANAESVEIAQGAVAYRDAKVFQAEGEAARFEALLAAYRDSKSVTRQRLYFEAMEEILPHVEKFVVEPNVVQMLPMFSYPRSGGASPAMTVPAVSAGPKPTRPAQDPVAGAASQGRAQ